MGRRSSFARIPKDLYRTLDVRAVPPLLPFLAAEGIRSYVEPCYGWGDLVGQLGRAGLTCRGRYDIEVRGRAWKDPADRLGGELIALDGRLLRPDHLNGADAIITNPPWARPVLHGLIDRFAPLATTWLLFDAGWASNASAAGLLQAYGTDYVPVPRLQWIPHTRDTATDDCGWYRFSAAKPMGAPLRAWARGQMPPAGWRADDFNLSDSQWRAA